MLRLCVSVIISILILVLIWVPGRFLISCCAYALTSKPWFVRTFEYRIQCSQTADSADKCGQLVRIRPAKTKASGTRWKAAQTTTVFCGRTVWRYAFCDANMVSKIYAVFISRGVFWIRTWWICQGYLVATFIRILLVSASCFGQLLDSTDRIRWGHGGVCRNLRSSLRWSFKWESWRPALQNWLVVRILGSKKLGLAQCSWNVWSETWSVDPLHIRQILSTITSLTHSQVVTLDADDSMSKWTDLKQLSIFHGGNGQSESSYFFVCQILSCQASWFQAMATLRFCHSHRPGLYPFLPHRSTTSSVQLTC